MSDRRDGAGETDSGTDPADVVDDDQPDEQEVRGTDADEPLELRGRPAGDDRDADEHDLPAIEPSDKGGEASDGGN